MFLGRSFGAGPSLRSGRQHGAGPSLRSGRQRCRPSPRSARQHTSRDHPARAHSPCTPSPNSAAHAPDRPPRRPRRAHARQHAGARPGPRARDDFRRRGRVECRRGAGGRPHGRRTLPRHVVHRAARCLRHRLPARRRPDVPPRGTRAAVHRRHEIGREHRRLPGQATSAQRAVGPGRTSPRIAHLQRRHARAGHMGSRVVEAHDVEGTDRPVRRGEFRHSLEHRRA